MKPCATHHVYALLVSRALVQWEKLYITVFLLENPLAKPKPHTVFDMETSQPCYIESLSPHFPDPPQLPPTNPTSTRPALLHTGHWNGYTTTVDQLLTYGSSIEAMDQNNNNPLRLAAQNDYTDIVERLLNNGASIEPTNRDSNTPFHLATGNGHIGVVKLLLRKGV